MLPVFADKMWGTFACNAKVPHTFLTKNMSSLYFMHTNWLNNCNLMTLLCFEQPGPDFYIKAVTSVYVWYDNTEDKKFIYFSNLHKNFM